MRDTRNEIRDVREDEEGMTKSSGLFYPELMLFINEPSGSY